jgi:predicted AAA+ superfamily ATPase
VPEPLRAIKPAVDRNHRLRCFVLTGSVNLLLMPKLGDSLVGRMVVLKRQLLTGAKLANELDLRGEAVGNYRTGCERRYISAASSPSPATHQSA